MSLIGSVNAIFIFNLTLCILFYKYNGIKNKNFWKILSLIVFAIFIFDFFIINKDFSLEELKNIKIEKIHFFYDEDKFFNILIGMSGLIMTMYIYILGVRESLKKNLINILMKPEKMIFIICVVLFTYFLNISFIYFFGLFLYLLILFPINLLHLIKIEKNIKKYIEEEEIFKKIKKENGCFELCRDLKSEVLKNIIAEDKVLFDENYYIFKKMLESDFFYEVEEEEVKKYAYEGTLFKFVKEISNQIKNIKNLSFFDELAYFYREVADFYYNDKKKNLVGYKNCIYNFEYLYKYYYKLEENREKKEFQGKIFKPLNFSLINFQNVEISEKIKISSAFLAGLTKTIKTIILNKDKESFNEILIFIDNALYIFYGEEQEKYFKYSFYFGLELLINTLRIKISDEIYSDFSKNCCKFELKYEFYDIEEFIKFYNFLERQEIKNNFEWDNFYIPIDELERYGSASWCDNSSKEINKLFIKKLSKYPLVKGLELTSSENKFFSEKFIFEEDLLELVDEEKKEEIKNFFKNIIKIKNDIKREQTREGTLSKKKITEIKSWISEELKNTAIIEYLKIINSYTSDESLEIRGINYGIRYFLEKELFFNEKKFGNEESIFKGYANSHKKGIEDCIQEKIKKIPRVEEVNFNNLCILSNKKDLVMIMRKNYINYLKNKLKDKSQKGNIKIKNEVSKDIQTKFGDLLIGSYQNEEQEIPIILLESQDEGAYLFDFRNLKFTHRTNILEDKKVGFCKMEIQEYEEFYKIWKEEKILNLEFLKKFDKKEERKKELELLVHFQLIQDFDIEVKYDAVRYKVVFDHKL